MMMKVKCYFGNLPQRVNLLGNCKAESMASNTIAESLPRSCRFAQPFLVDTTTVTASLSEMTTVTTYMNKPQSDDAFGINKLNLIESMFRKLSAGSLLSHGNSSSSDCLDFARVWNKFLNGYKTN